MKTEVNVQFRLGAAEVKGALPPPLHFLRSAVREGMRGQSYAVSAIDPQLLDPLIAWGRVQEEGKSRVRLLRINEKWEIADLAGLRAVELHASDEMDDTLHPTNFAKALQAKWDCSECKRSCWTQVEDLEFRPKRAIDLQPTELGGWLVSSRARQVLGPDGLTTRDLHSKSDWQQLEVTDRFGVDLDRSPLCLSASCEVCGRPQRLHRNDLVEGEHVGCPDITISRDMPLVISPPTRPGWTIAASDQEFGSFTRLPAEKTHQAGEPIKLERQHLTGMYPKREYIVSIDTAQRLAANRIRGIAFRPVVIV